MKTITTNNTIDLSIKCKKNEKHIMQFAYDAGNFSEGDFKGHASISAHSFLMTLDDGRQFQVDFIDILSALKKEVE